MKESTITNQVYYLFDSSLRELSLNDLASEVRSEVGDEGGVGGIL